MKSSRDRSDKNSIVKNPFISNPLSESQIRTDVDQRLKNAIYQKFWQLKNVIFKLFGGPRGSPSEKFLSKILEGMLDNPRLK